MLKRIFVLSALLGALSLFADAISIGHTRNGYPLIVPQVQGLKAASGSFALPCKLTVAAPDTLDLAPLVRIYGQTVSGGSVERVDASALCRFELTTGNVPKSPEGYTIAITPSGITIRARDVRGLYYGMQTLNMLLRHRVDAGTLKCCRITDWPDLRMRGLFFQLRRITPDQVDRVCHVIDVLGSLKYNTLVITFADNFPYTDSPFTGRKTTLSRADIERILGAAKRNHIEVIPLLQLISHANWMNTHKDWAKLQEGKANAFCLSNPDLQPLIEKCVRETADLIKPRYFYIGLDEIEQCGFPKCSKCKAVPVMEQMLKHLLPVKKLLADRGITPIIYQDQFFGFGEPQRVQGLGITNFPEKFGRDIVIESWEYGAHPSPMIGNAIKRRGFNKFRYLSFGVSIDNAQNLPKLAHQLGADGVTLSYWGMVPSTLDGLYPGCRSLYPSFIVHANYTWNTNDSDFAKLPIDGSLLLQELLDGTPDRTFKGTATPIALGGAFNQCFSNDPVFPVFDVKTSERMCRIVANDPAKFDLRIQNGTPLAMVLSGSRLDGFAKGPITIPVNTSASGASFLVTAALFNNYGLLSGQFSDSKRAVNIGELEVVYTDGSSAVIPLKMNFTINDWNTYIGGPLCRAVVRGNDRNGALFSLYAIDWRNPHPDKEIKEIVFSSKGDTGISPILFAISLSNAEKTPAGVAGTTPVFTPVHRPAAKRMLAVNFSNKSQAMTGDSKDVKNYSYKIVTDPQCGEVLEMRMPETQKFLARTWVDFDVPTPSVDFESVVFDIKVSGWSAIYRPDFYMMRGGSDVGTLNFADELGDRWITVCIPRERIFKPGSKLKPEAIDRLSIRFSLLDNGVPCIVHVGNIYYCDQVLPCRANVTTPVK